MLIECRAIQSQPLNIQLHLTHRFNEFDQRFFGITDAEMEQMDPQHKMLLHCTYRALENAGIPMEKASGSRTGVFLGNDKT